MWKKEIIIRDNGEKVEAIFPVIISASRSTDIPAFHSRWFMNRLEKGYLAWVNPFNRSNPQFVSFRDTRAIIFWTKNPKPFISLLPRLDEFGMNYYFQYTLNDYDKEGFEPNVKRLKDRMEVFKHLSELIGKEKMVWRFDPLILTSNISVRDLLKRIWYLGNQIVNHTNKLVFSFVDITNYKKVQNNLCREMPDVFSKNDVSENEFNQDQKIEFAEGIQKIHQEWLKKNPAFEIATCAEDFDLEKYNIVHNKCIDDDLLIKLFPRDQKLMSFLGVQFDMFGQPIITKKLKDKGQRAACGCIYSKDIGAYNTCDHLCIYCYANTSANMVKNNIKKLDKDSESLLPG